MTIDLYAWKAPRDIDAEEAEALLRRWQEAGGDPSDSPFEPSSDVGWFYRELTTDVPGVEAASDAKPSVRSTPLWMSATDEPPARVVGIRLPSGTPRDTLEAIFGLSAKYDLVLFEARKARLHFPLEEMATYASSTFWPAGAIQAAVAGGIGGIIAVVAFILAIPVVSGIGVVIGGFMFVMAVLTFVLEGRKRVTARRARCSGR